MSRRKDETQSVRLKGRLREVKGVVFDVDGTLCVSQKSMFANMRRVLSIQKPTDILNHVRSLPKTLPDTTPPTLPTALNNQPSALATIHDIARDSCTTQKLRPGARELMESLEKRGLRKGICSRNFDIPIRHLCERLLAGNLLDLGPVITRETPGVAPKPSPEGVWVCARVWAGEMDLLDHITVGGIPKQQGDDDQKGLRAGFLEGVDREHLKKLASQVVVVGDSIDDMLAGHRAGAMTILVRSSETEKELLQEVEEERCEIADFVVDELGEIVTLLEDTFDRTRSG